ncbi:MAG: hypothetical protein SGCHY_005315, partial [Lobulomycetales sp.]
MEGVPLADMMKHNAQVAERSGKQQQQQHERSNSGGGGVKRSDMHQNTDELQRQLQEFREKKLKTGAAATVKSSVAQDYTDTNTGAPITYPPPTGYGIHYPPQGVAIWGRPPPPPPLKPAQQQYMANGSGTNG